MLTSPYGGGVTTFDSTAGTRKPFIAGANGENVAGNFIDQKDPTLDPKYAAGLPRTPVPSVTRTRAVTGDPRTFFQRRVAN
jgi:hypothetical protein